jgi:methyltransferase (TIGR00027 family)
MENQAAKTAWGPVFQAALEQLMPEKERIIQDTLAYRFLPAYLRGAVNLLRIDTLRRGLLNLVDRKAAGIRGGILCRKRYMQEKLKDALRAGIPSVVILGAGFDTLAYLVADLASRHVYEVDLPQIMGAKQAKLEEMFGKAPAHVKLVPLDFESQNLELVLQQAGFSWVEPAFFVWEGVTQYLTETAVREVFEYLCKAPAGSQLVFTYILKDFIEGKQLYRQELLYRQTRIVKQFWKFGLNPQEVRDFLSRYSWKELEQAGSAEYQELYIKPVKRSLQVMAVERAVHAVKTPE